MKKNDELRAMDLAELEKELLELRKEQFTLRMKKATGALDKFHLIPRVRKSIARVKTVMTEKAGTEND